MTELLYRLLEDNWRHARLSEDRRIVITSLNTIAGSAITITVGILGLNLRVLPVTIWMIILGMFGLLACLRLEERAQFHALRARQLRAKLGQIGQADAEELLQRSDHEHAARYPHLGRFRLHYSLVGINASIVLLSIGASVACLRQ